jgi:hypothetical protein
MPWFKQHQKKAPLELHIPRLSFIGEQAGPPEERLKGTLIDFFKRDQSVTKAYLARVDFGNGNPAGVALCLRTLFGTDKGMVEKIGTIFASVFNVQEHLDIMFLTDEQEVLLVKVCQPFFVRDCDGENP